MEQVSVCVRVCRVGVVLAVGRTRLKMFFQLISRYLDLATGIFESHLEISLRLNLSDGAAAHQQTHVRSESYGA